MSKQKAYFAGGCFWCIAPVFRIRQGVLRVVSGYCDKVKQIPKKKRGSGRIRAFLRLSSAPFHPPDQGKDKIGEDVGGDDGGADGGIEEDGGEDPEDGADDGEDPGADSHAEKGAVHPHRRQRREDQERGDKERADQIHREDDDDGGNDGDEEVVKPDANAARLGERRVKGDGEQPAVKQHERRENKDGKDDAERDLRARKGQDGGGTEERGTDVPRHVPGGGKEVEQEITERHRADREHRDGGVAARLFVFPGAKEEDRAQDGDRQHEEHLIGKMEHGGNGERAEGGMGQPVPDKGEAPQNQRDAEERRAERDQHPDDQGALDKRIGEIFPQTGQPFSHGRLPPFRG